MTPSESVARPAVSVIMPCLDGMPYLPQAVEAVLNQDIHLELIVVDGGSTDGSLEWLRSRDHPALRVESTSARPAPGPARNLGLALARAQRVAFVDTDDVWKPGKLARQLRVLEHAGAVVAYSDCSVIDREGRRLGRYHSRQPAPRGRVFRSLLRGNFVPLSTVLTSRSVIERVGGFPSGYRVGADYLLLIRIARLGSFAYVPDELCAYRVHGGNITADFRRAYRDNVAVFDTLLEEERGGRDASAVREGRALVLWRWAIREAMSGPGSLREAAQLALEAWRASTGVGRIALPVRAGLGGLRGLLLRLRMSGARRRATR